MHYSRFLLQSCIPVVIMHYSRFTCRMLVFAHTKLAIVSGPLMPCWETTCIDFLYDAHLHSTFLFDRFKCNVRWCIASHFLCSCVCDMEHESAIKYYYYYYKLQPIVPQLPHSWWCFHSPVGPTAVEITNENFSFTGRYRWYAVSY